MKRSSDVVDKKVFKKTLYNTLVTKVNKLEENKFLVSLFQFKQLNTTQTRKNGEKTSKNGDVAKTIFVITGLTTTSVLITKNSGVQIKISDITELLKKADYHAKIKDIELKYFTTADYNKFYKWNTWYKDKSKKLVLWTWYLLSREESWIKHRTLKLATKVEWKAEQDKIVKLQTHDLSFLLGKRIFGDDGLHIIFAYQQKLDTFRLK